MSGEMAPGTLPRKPGLRNACAGKVAVPPSVFASAAKTPGEAAQTVLTISCYLVLMFLIIGFGGERVQRVPGVFQVMAAGLLLVPAMMISSRLWRWIGERMRDRVRILFRFWPLTLFVLIFLLGGIRMLME